MNSINSISGQLYIPTAQMVTAENACHGNCSSRRLAFDSYTSDRTKYQSVLSTGCSLLKNLALDLAKKFDPSDMSRSQYSQLISILRNAGIISSQEFSIAYAGSMPTTDLAVLWPHDGKRLNFTNFLQDCAQSCKKFGLNTPQGSDEQAKIESMDATYSHLHRVFSQIENPGGTSSKKTPSTEAQKEVERLVDLLMQDDSFSKRKHSFTLYQPEGQLASAMIMADEGVQAQIAEKLSVSIPKMQAMLQMLQGHNERDRGQVLLHYQHMLAAKANAGKLTETEKLLSSDLERVNLGAQSTFDEKMGGIYEEILLEFQKHGLNLDDSKSFSFSYNESTRCFSVTGGTDEENSLVESVINYENQIEGKFNLARIFGGLCNHRNIEVNEETSRKLKQLFIADEKLGHDDYLKNRYGFGWEDIEHIGNGVIVGKTDEITKVIKDLGESFIMYGGGSFLSEIHSNLISKYGFGLDEITVEKDGEIVGRTKEVDRLVKAAGAELKKDIRHPGEIDMPVFDEPLFVLENGHFKAFYEE